MHLACAIVSLFKHKNKHIKYFQFLRKYFNIICLKLKNCLGIKSCQNNNNKKRKQTVAERRQRTRRHISFMLKLKITYE